MPAASGQNVVVGTGPLGLSVLEVLDARGLPARAVNRTGVAEGVPEGIETVSGDVSDPEEAARLFEGAPVVYQCAAPPYGLWKDAFLPMVEGVLEGAEAAGVHLVFGDNLYMYGPAEGPITEALPYRAEGQKGRVRAEGAERLLDAHERGRCRVSIARGSDFYGPGVTRSWVGERLFLPVIRGQAVRPLCGADEPHSFTYIKDFAQTLVALGTREETAGEVWHVPNAPAVTLREFVAIAAEAAGTEADVKPAPRFLGWLMGLLNRDVRELREVFYQWDEPFVVDDSKTRNNLGLEHTPLREGIEATVRWYREDYIR